MFYEHESQTEKFTATNKDERNKPNTEIITEILSIELDDNLNFGDHIKNLCSKLNKLSGLFYQLRSILTVKQLLLTYRVYVQPVVSYGVLVYGTSNKTLVLPLESKIKQITRSVFSKPKSTSTSLERKSNHIYLIRVMQHFELLKKLAEILRAECHIDCLKNVFTRKEIETLQAKRIQSKQLKTAIKSSGLSPKRLRVRIPKLLNFILRFYLNFVLEVQHLSARELKQFLSKLWYLLLRASGRIGRMVLQKLKLCSSISKKH